MLIIQTIIAYLQSSTREQLVSNFFFSLNNNHNLYIYIKPKLLKLLQFSMLAQY